LADAGDQADDAGRSQQCSADLAHHRKRQQDQRHTHQDDRAHQHTAQHPGLGLDATRLEVVGHLHRVIAQDRLFARGHRAYQQPDEAAGQADMQQPQCLLEPVLLQRRGLQGRNQQQQRQRERQGPADHPRDAGTAVITVFQTTRQRHQQPPATDPDRQRDRDGPEIQRCLLPVDGHGTLLCSSRGRPQDAGAAMTIVSGECKVRVEDTHRCQSA